MNAVVDLIRIDLDAVSEEALFERTSWQERAEAARRRRSLDGRRFLARRVAMRSNLAHLLGRAIKDVSLSRDRLGRPMVRDGSMHISQSSRRNVMIAAFCTDRPIGCDVEEVLHGIDIDAVAALCFGPTERRLLRAMGPARRLHGFYDCWTRKEAYLKAIGTGMAVEMASFQTTHRAGPPTRWGRVDWSSESWSPLPGFAAAVVARGTDWRMQHRPDATALCVSVSA
ncbi:4'-phosphopantetheinyl transferase family protein [Sphingomonas sp. 3-13AW]|jgi:4'-phosphopantetheinyl transferase|uniref:4'-phosphopantetheinyl transferase family protein n=1 Tax=Sphingomonas sp. 3-13AW TaxID=3050450 RepID=UPI003BB5CC01